MRPSTGSASPSTSTRTRTSADGIDRRGGALLATVHYSSTTTPSGTAAVVFGDSDGEVLGSPRWLTVIARGSRTASPSTRAASWSPGQSAPSTILSDLFGCPHPAAGRRPARPPTRPVGWSAPGSSPMRSRPCTALHDRTSTAYDDDLLAATRGRDVAATSLRDGQRRRASTVVSASRIAPSPSPHQALAGTTSTPAWSSSHPPASARFASANFAAFATATIRAATASSAPPPPRCPQYGGLEAIRSPQPHDRPARPTPVPRGTARCRSRSARSPPRPARARTDDRQRHHRRSIHVTVVVARTGGIGLRRQWQVGSRRGSA